MDVDIPFPKKTKKQPADTVSRIFHDDKLNSTGTRRLTVIVYKYNKITKECTYAAALYKEDTEDEYKHKFGSKRSLKKALRETALRRLDKKPIIINIDDDKSLLDFHSNIRKSVYVNGAYSKKEN